MKNKKIVVCLLIAVLVLGLTLTALVGCKQYKDVKYEDMSAFLTQAVENTVKDKKLNNINLGANMTVETSYGESTKTYSIEVAASLDLTKNGENKNAASLEIRDVTGNKNVVSAYYNEQSPYVYLLLGENNKYRLNAFSVYSILNKNNAFLGDTASEEIGNSVVKGIESVFDGLGMVTSFEGLLKTQVNKKGTSYRLSVNLGEVLKGSLINDLLGEEGLGDTAKEIIKDLGIDLDLNNLSEILPALELGININVSSKKAEEALITGVSADLSCPQKNVVIKKTDDKGNLIELNIAKDFKAKASLDFLFGNAEVKFPADSATYTNTIGAINLSASGSLKIDKQVQMSLLGILNIDVPADTYKLDVAIAADPAKLVNLDFTGIHSTPHAIDVAIEAVTSAVDYLNLKITKANNDTFLQLELKKQNNQLVLGEINLNALGLPSAISSILGGGKSIQAIWTSLSGLEMNGKKLIDLGDGLDAGYVFADASKGYKGGYKVDTANGYVDKDEDGNPDKDSNGNFVVNKDAGYELYKGRPWKKSDLPCYDADGNVKTSEGYTETKKGSKQVKYNDDGDFMPASGYVLEWVNLGDDENPLWMNLPMKEDEYKELHKNDPESDEGLIPSTVKDLISGLSIVAKGGQISVTLGGFKLCVNEDEVKESEEAHKLDESVAVVAKKYATLSATLTVDKSGININGNVKGLDGLAEKKDGEWTSYGLPDDLNATITIKLSDIKYGTAGKTNN